MRLFSKVKLVDFIYSAYHAWPKFYHNIAQLISVGQWEKWQNRIFEDLCGKKILEIGVGSGSLFIRMAKKGYIMTGVELRYGMSYEARKKIKEAGFDIDILHQSVYKMPFRDETFDCIVMTFVLAEISDMDKAVEEMKRVLKKGGKVIIIAGGMPQDRNPIAKFLFGLVRYQTTLRLERDNKAYFEKHGFLVSREDFGPFNIINKLVAVK